MLGSAAKPGQSILQRNGQLTLEQMSLDQREEFNGDAFDPFNVGVKKNNVESIQLQQADNYMGINNTVGAKIWTPE